jgi:hypothetical protein
MPDNDVTCTLTNTRKQGTLRIAKICAPITSSQTFTVNVSSYGNVSVGCGGSTSAIPLPTGTYTVGESSLPSGWVRGGSVATAIGGGWAAPGTFSGDCDANGSVTLNSGDNKTCYILNVSNVCTPAFSFAPSSGGSAMPAAPMTAVPNRQPTVPRPTTNPQRTVRK